MRGMVSDQDRMRAHLDIDHAAVPVSQETDYGTSESARYLTGSPTQTRAVDAYERVQTGMAALATKGSETATSVTAGAAGAIVAVVCVLLCVFVALALSLAAIVTTSIAQEQLSPEGVAACAGQAYTEGETRGDWWWRGDRYRSLCGGSIGPWDAAFVCWCLSTCGLVDEGLAPLAATTPELVDFYLTHPEAGQVISHDAAYVPGVGDLLVEGLGEEGVTPHVSIVVEVEGSSLTCIEGDSAGGARGNYDAGADGIGGYVVARQREVSESYTYIHINFEGVS